MYIILLSSFVFYALFLIWKWRFFKFSWNNHAFFVPLLPLIGTMYLPVIFGCKDVVTAVRVVGSKLGFPFNVWIAFDYYYITKNPLDIKAVFHNLSAQNKGSVYDDIAYLFPNSLLTTHYKTWRIRRKEYLKSFKPSTLKRYCLDYFQNSADLVEQFKNRKGEIAISYDVCNRFTFKNFFTTSVGLNQNPEHFSIFADKLLEFEEDLGKKLLNPLLPMSIWSRLHPGGIKTINAMNTIKTVIKQIQEKKLQLRGDEEDNPHFEDTDLDQPLLDLMMNIKRTVVNEEDIFTDMVFIAAAATDTTGHTLMAAFTYLGIYQDVQQKLYEEVTDIGGELTFNDLSKLVYTEAVINETLRLFPVIPFLSRVLEKDIDLGDKVIPRGSHFGVSILDLHRDEKYWPNPLKFDPDRFLTENVANIQPCTFIPFSTGPRDCIGKSQAMAMMKIIIASIVRTFRINSKHTPTEEFQYTSGITMKTRHPLDCTFKLRV
ncbi:hypothetical protein HUJ04_001774 [Dendroctonus ponderosae]|uniref:Cytochrome P450 n=1 Tax=Dendroctonus ponderosae TaxID=77166 RepID=A0AAR5P6Q0_DENPD|nr:hypothetical protein HUJ04_001774 [Dendroctonus ponderosae]